LIYQATTPHPVIVLEDLAEKGFVMNAEPPKNYEESKVIVQRLAKFHAGSFFLVEEKVPI
jgi:hypothetical protein